MKTRSLYTVLFLISQLTAYMQVSINSDNSLPDPSAMLEIKTTERGFLPPRMTTDQMNSIPEPPDGLLVYNTTAGTLYWFDGSAWQKFSQVGFEETDPVFIVHPAYRITNQKILEWNTAYGWGNHALAGYLTQYNESDPVFTAHPASGISAANITNWNNAYNTRLTGTSGTPPLTLDIAGNALTGSMTKAGVITSGYLSAEDWNTFNNKQNAMTFGNLGSQDITITGGTGAVFRSGTNLTVMKGNLTSSDMTITGGSGALPGSGATLTIIKGNLSEATTSVLTITGGENAVLGSGTTLKVKQASTTQSGYLSSTDWSAFNSKQNPVTFGNLTSSDIIITGGTSAVKGSGVTLAIAKGNLTSPDFTVTGGAGAVFGNGTNLTINKGNLTESSSSVLTITNGNNVVLGSGTTLQVKQAAAGQSGFLSAADWNSFNNKVSSQWMSDGPELSYSSGNVAIGSTGTENSALLELNSTTQGFLPPRMTIAQRDVMPDPALGMIIVCSDCPAPFNLQIYTGSSWVPMPFNRYPAATEVEQSGGAYILNTLTGSYTFEDEDHDPEGATQYCWYRADNPSGINESAISGATNLTYIPVFSDVGKYIRFSVTPVALRGASPGLQVKSSTFLGPVSSFACGSNSFSINHNPLGGVAPVLKTVSYNTVTNIPGEQEKCWVTRNLGATRPANSVDDSSPDAAGWYWQFNRKQGYEHDGTTLTPAWNYIPVSENTNWLSSNDPCLLELGEPWRLPTHTEWYNVDVTDDWDTWSDPWNSGLKLHAAGYITSGGFITSRGFTGRYTSSVQFTNTMNYYLIFNEDVCGRSYDDKTMGISVRCIREN